MKNIKIVIIILSLSLFLTGCAQIDSLIGGGEESDSGGEQGNNNVASDTELQAVLESREQALVDRYSGEDENVIYDDNYNPDNFEGTKVFSTINTDGLQPAGSLDISVGDAVEWTNNSSETITLSLFRGDLEEANQTLEIGQKYVFLFANEGEYLFSILPGDLSSSISVTEPDQTSE